MLEKSVIALSILISYFLQTSVSFFSLAGVKPDFLLILTIYFAVFRGSFSGLWIGFMGGLLQDFNLGGILDIQSNQMEFFTGIHALPKALVGFIVGKLSRNINKESPLIISLMLFSASIGYGIFVFSSINIFHQDIAAEAFFTKIFPESIYNAILSVVWMKFLKWAMPSVYSVTSRRYL